MTKEQLALQLNGREYLSELSQDEHVQAREHGLLVIYGSSDDLMELRGIIYDEIGIWDGGKVHIFKNEDGVLSVMCEEEYKEKQDVAREIGYNGNSVIVEALWTPYDIECSWLMSSSIPNSTFDIMEDGDLYCRGIVIEKSDILKALQ